MPLKLQGREATDLTGDAPTRGTETCVPHSGGIPNDQNGGVLELRLLVPLTIPGPYSHQHTTSTATYRAYGSTCVSGVTALHVRPTL